MGVSHRVAIQVRILPINYGWQAGISQVTDFIWLLASEMVKWWNVETRNSNPISPWSNDQLVRFMTGAVTVTVIVFSSSFLRFAISVCWPRARGEREYERTWMIIYNICYLFNVSHVGLFFDTSWHLFSQVCMTQNGCHVVKSVNTNRTDLFPFGHRGSSCTVRGRTGSAGQRPPEALLNPSWRWRVPFSAFRYHFSGLPVNLLENRDNVTLWTNRLNAGELFFFCQNPSYLIISVLIFRGHWERCREVSEIWTPSSVGMAVFCSFDAFV